MKIVTLTLFALTAMATQVSTPARAEPLQSAPRPAAAVWTCECVQSADGFWFLARQLISTTTGKTLRTVPLGSLMDSVSRCHTHLAAHPVCRQ